MMKWIRVLVSMALLLVGVGAAAEAPVCVVTEECAALLSADGTEIIAPGRYVDIFVLVPGERYALAAQTTEGVRYAMADAAGKLLTDFEFSMLRESDGVILFRSGSLYGAMDMQGELLLPAMYTHLVTTGEQDFLALIGDPNDDSADAVMRVSLDNTASPTGIRTSDGLTSFSEGRMSYRSANTERYGYLNSTGGVGIEAVFEYAGNFENGCARAAQQGKLGVIARNGTWIIPPEYDFLEIGDGVIVCLKERGLCVVYDAADFTERFRIEGENLSAATVAGRVVVSDGSNLMLYDKNGSLIGSYPGSASIYPGAGGQMLLSDGEWGGESMRIIEADGTLSERAYQHLMPLSDDRYAFMQMRAAAYYSDVLEGIRYSCDYGSMRFGLMDSQGNEILPAEYLELRALAKERYLVQTEDELCLIDDSGAVLWRFAKETTEE